MPGAVNVGLAVVSVPGTIPDVGVQVKLTGLAFVPTVTETDGVLHVIVALLGVNVTVGTFESVVTATVCCELADELHPLIVFVTYTVYTPADDEYKGIAMTVADEGVIQVYVVPGSALLLAVNVAVGLAHVATTVGVVPNVKVGVTVF